MPGGDPIASVESAVDHAFSDRHLLREALTHSSFAAENDRASSYERLEFLGDAVLELVTTHMIFDAMEGGAEGEMTKIRASVVDETTLAAVGRSWGVDAAVLLGVGEERSGGRDRDSIISDVVESLIAAVYLDAGLPSTEALIRREWAPIIAERIRQPDVSDPRSRLQEILARRGEAVVFTYERTGPDHATVFTATASVDGRVVGVGEGGSKKTAAIAAAADALSRGM